MTTARIGAGRTAWLAAMLVGMGSMCMPLFAPALPEIGAHFGTDEAGAQGALTIYLAGFVSMQLVCGPLSDRFGRRPVAAAFLGLFIVASLGTLLARDLGSFLGFRLLQGIGASAGVAVGRALVMDQYRGAEALSIMAVVSLILGAAPAVAPALGGFAATWGGWRATLWLMLAFGLVAISCMWWLMPETRSKSAASLDPRVIARGYGAILADPRFLWATLACAGAAVSFQVQGVMLPFILVRRLGVPEYQFGLMMLMCSSFFIAGNLVSGRMRKGRGYDAPIAIGVWLMLGAAALYAGLQLAFGLRLWTVLPPVMLACFAGAMMFPGLIALALLPIREAPGAAASLNMFIQFVVALSVAVAASHLFEAVAGFGVSLAFAAGLAFAAWLVWRKLPDRLG